MMQVGNGKRGSLEIIADILNSCPNGIRKTSMMSLCNISSTQAEKYLDVILKTRLMEVENRGHHLMFRVSDKGRRFLAIYRSLKALIE